MEHKPEDYKWWGHENCAGCGTSSDPQLNAKSMAVQTLVLLVLVLVGGITWWLCK